MFTAKDSLKTKFATVLQQWRIAPPIHPPSPCQRTACQQAVRNADKRFRLPNICARVHAPIHFQAALDIPIRRGSLKPYFPPSASHPKQSSNGAPFTFHPRFAQIRLVFIAIVIAARGFQAASSPHRAPNPAYNFPVSTP
ncbi:hypothetical protein [Kingella oralis]|uniref:hypothetical protein n=1 Tax=Kingella oralis TaxID=505 RepID=UPI0034E480BC